jgi:hypothetical protein
MTIKKQNSKKATIIAGYSEDLSLVLNWLRLNKAITQVGNRRELERGFAVSVKSKLSKKDLNTMVKDRFGIFAKVI